MKSRLCAYFQCPHTEPKSSSTAPTQSLPSLPSLNYTESPTLQPTPAPGLRGIQQLTAYWMSSLHERDNGLKRNRQPSPLNPSFSKPAQKHHSTYPPRLSSTPSRAKSKKLSRKTARGSGQSTQRNSSSKADLSNSSRRWRWMPLGSPTCLLCQREP